MIKKQKTVQLELLKRYRIANPYLLDEDGFDKIIFDILAPRADMVYDEYVDFLLWNNQKPGRQEGFLHHLSNHLLPTFSSCRKILEVGCGRYAWLSRKLADMGYQVTAIDPRLSKDIRSTATLKLYSNAFHSYDQKCLQLASSQDLVLAQEPCDGTEQIVRACEQLEIPYYIVLCGAPHMRIDQVLPHTRDEWYGYLQELAPAAQIEQIKIWGIHYNVMYHLASEL